MGAGQADFPPGAGAGPGAPPQNHPGQIEGALSADGEDGSQSRPRGGALHGFADQSAGAGGVADVAGGLWARADSDTDCFEKGSRMGALLWPELAKLG